MGYYFSLIFYGLFLLFFRTQTDNPHCLFNLPSSLRSYPHYYRIIDIPLAYSSSFEAATTQSIVVTLSSFRSLFKDYKPPIHPQRANPMFQYIFMRINNPSGYQLTSLVREPQNFKELSLYFTKLRSLKITSKFFKKIL